MNKLPNYFDAAYLINLPERGDRLRSTKKQFVRVGWEIGASSIRIFSALRFADPAGFPNASIRGCFQSHLECLRRALAAGCRSVLVLEDDIALSVSLPRLTPSALMRLNALDWDFVYFGHYGTGEIPLARRNTDESELRFEVYTGEILTTHFYAVNGRILRKLIAHLDKIASGRAGDQATGPMPIDGAYNIFRRNNPDVRCVIVHPKLGWQSSSRSDITPHVLDRLAFLRPLNAVLRELKGMATRWHR